VGQQSFCFSKQRRRDKPPASANLKASRNRYLAVGCSGSAEVTGYRAHPSVSSHASDIIGIGNDILCASPCANPPSRVREISVKSVRRCGFIASMPSSERLRPRVATCEDYDDDADTTLPNSQTTANVSAKRSQHDLDPRKLSRDDLLADGGDSGYASRAATVASNSTTASHRRMPDLKLDTAGIPERERHPYSYIQSPAAKPVDSRQSAPKWQEPSPEKRSSKTREVASDRAYTERQASYAEAKSALNSARPPPSPVQVRDKVVRTVVQEEQLPPPKARRSSSHHQQRPANIIPVTGPIPVQYATVLPTYAPPPMAAGYHTPVTPSVPYSPVQYTYTPTTALPTPAYVYQQMPAAPSYFDQLPEPRSARQSRQPSPSRRKTMYAEPPLRQDFSDLRQGSLQRVPSNREHPALSAHKSSRSMDVDRSMPPPPRPKQTDGVARRPSIRKSKTYYEQEPVLRESAIIDADRYEVDDDYDRRVRVVPVATRDRDRRESSTMPPSAYRPPTNLETRPSPRKALSYSAGTTKTTVATTPTQSVPRRMTTHLEQKVSEVEDYTDRTKADEYKRSRAKSGPGLTQEALRKLDQRTSSSKSEAGSNFSHQSSSRDSSGRNRSQTSGHKTSITAGGVTMTIPANYNGRPLSMNIDGLVVSLAPEGKENERPQQKRIEKAPSVNSRTSKQSITSSAVSSRDKDRGREVPPTATRRPSQLEDRGPSVRSSRQASRAPSRNRQSVDFASRRQSVDYSREYDEFNGSWN
jgi:hypothetical protein